MFYFHVLVFEETNQSWSRASSCTALNRVSATSKLTISTSTEQVEITCLGNEASVASSTSYLLNFLIEFYSLRSVELSLTTMAKLTIHAIAPSVDTAVRINVSSMLLSTCEV